MYRSTSEAAPIRCPAFPPARSSPGRVPVKNLTPLGHSAAQRAVHRHGQRRLQLRPGLQGQPGLRGHLRGLPDHRLHEPVNPIQIVNYTGCNVGQGDVIVYGNLLIRSWDAEASATSTCAGQLVGAGLRGHPHLRHRRPGEPGVGPALRFADNGHATPARWNGCGSHTATAVPDPARGFLYIYNGGSNSNCPGIDIFGSRSPTRPTRRDPAPGIDAPASRRQHSCHDNNVLMNVGGTASATRCARAATASRCSSST